MNHEADLTDPGELLASIPAMMGFVPGESCIVIYGSKEGLMKGAVMCAINAPQEEVLEVAQGLNEQAADLCVIVLVTPSPRKAVNCLNWLMEALTVHVVEIFGASSLEPGAEYVNPLNQSVKGRIPDWRESILTVMQVSEGRPIYASEAELASTYAPSSPVSKVILLSLDRAATLLTRLGDALVQESREHLPTPGEIGSLLVYGEATRYFIIHLAAQHGLFAHNIFSETGKYVRGQARVEALTVAGIAAFVSKQGSLAQAAFKAADETAELMDPPYRSEILHRMSEIYFSGVHPDSFLDTFFTPEGDKK